LTIGLTWLRRELTRNSDDVRASLEALRAGEHPSREWRVPLYRSWRIAADSGVKAAISFALAAIFFVVTGWPTTELCLSLVAIVIGISAAGPDMRAFTTLALVATPIACLLAGILKYLVLDGVSEFQLLAIGLAPFIVGPALLMTLPNPKLAGIGRLVLVFMLAILAPANPQTYDALTFVITCLFVCLSTIIPFVVQILLPPWSNDRKLRQLLSEARRAPLDLHIRRHRHLAPEEATFRDATRIGQIATASGPAPNPSVLNEAMRYFDRIAALRLCRSELDRLANGPLADAANAARTALAGLNANAMLASAKVLHEAALPNDSSGDPACGALVLASVIFDAGSSDEGEP